MRKFAFFCGIVLFGLGCSPSKPSHNQSSIDSLRFSLMAQEKWIFHPVFDSLQTWQGKWMLQQNTWNTILDSSAQNKLKREFPNYFEMGNHIDKLLKQHQTLKTIYDVDMVNINNLKTALESGATQDGNGTVIQDQYWPLAIQAQTAHQDSLNSIINVQLQDGFKVLEQLKMMYPLFQQKISTSKN